MRRLFLSFLIAISLSWTAVVRTDGFSPAIIGEPLLSRDDPCVNTEVKAIFFQPFRYLGKGRQCFVFESQDGQTVLKFFNQNYLKMPWYSFFVEKSFKAPFL
jgi:hypothetical protein